ncbi:MAG: guanitoxin biosynthesis heme-dependent pre-guanitoxin N-hydroxylase GntA [Chloroflexota bacterium]
MQRRTESLFEECSPGNPFDNAIARASSNYCAFDGKRLSRALDGGRPPSRVTSYVHDAFRSLVLNPTFACVGAKSAVRAGGYRFGLYDEMGTAESTSGLAHDLHEFVDEQPSLGSEFTTYAASFTGPTAMDEAAFERRLWSQLQRLHDIDHRIHGWDPSVSSSPADSHFSFSFARCAFFVVGLHAGSSRWTRRFAWPSLVFNAHAQFDRLREQGRFVDLQRSIRARDQALQSAPNPSLSTFGELSEARQYSGRATEPTWTCPFHTHEQGKR